MKNKVSRLLMTLIASSVLITSINALAAPVQTFSNVFTFGDSFSESANSWAALTTEHYGFKFTNNQTNFALGEATTADLNAELNNYKANVKGFDPNALYMMYMGPSDINRIYTEIQLDRFDLGQHFYEVLDKLKNGSLKLQDFPRARTVTKLAAVEKNAGEFIKNISDSGAKYIIVLNHFNEFHRQPDAALIGRDDEQKVFLKNY